MTEPKRGSADAELQIPEPNRSLERLLRHHLHSDCRQADRLHGNSPLDFHLLLSLCLHFCRYSDRSLWACNREASLVALSRPIASTLPFLAASFVSLPCILASCGAFELTSLQFSPLRRFSKFPISHAVVPESISYVRMSCFIVGQRATVREQLRNYCATRISTVCPADARPSPASTTERLTDLASQGWPDRSLQAPFLRTNQGRDVGAQASIIQ